MPRDNVRPGSLQPLDVIRPSQWAGKRAPPRRWLIDGILSHQTVTIFSGDGGIGKSLVCQQLQSACAIGRPWLGIDVPVVKSLGIYCEDTPEELWRRQEDINRFYETEMEVIDENVTLISRVGKENIMMAFDKFDNEGQTTAFYDQVAQLIVVNDVQLVIIDTAADTFGGNEIMRNQVRSFINKLRKLVIQQDGGIILTQHPSLGGRATGTGESGSTAWNNSARGRVYMHRPKSDNGDDIGNEVKIKTMKTNYGPKGEIIVQWDKGVFVRTDGYNKSDKVDRIAVDLMVKEGIRKLTLDGHLCSLNQQGRSYVIHQLLTLPESRGYSRVELASSIDRQLKNGSLRRGTVRRGGRATICVYQDGVLPPDLVSDTAQNQDHDEQFWTT